VVPLQRHVDRFPFVPADPALLDENCYEAFNIQVHGLITRLRATGIKKVVLGISGGLDSTHALIVAARAFDQLELPRKNILCYTLPGFATSKHTKTNAHALMEAFGVNADEIDITTVSRQTLVDIGHPNAQGQPVYDVTFENVQAGARTALLFRLANFHDAIVMGTGDLSELALGWCTYGVGDQMSHYNVNGSVPKTLIQHLIRWVADRGEFGQLASDVLRSILATEISPELVPGDGEKPAQRTEDVVGPYALQDFNLYYITRYGLRPSKVAFLSWNAWRDVSAGAWPAGMREQDQMAYDLAAVRKWLRVFLFRFFQISQFKRSAMPNGPKVGSGGSLSPRGDWRAPSDSHADVWLAELDANVPEQA
jgi:NAD+ synthase (glutamine-hydrolysing)